MSSVIGKRAFENIEACVFDAYGTLFDVHTAVGTFQAEIGPDYVQLSAAWRRRQLEYTWLRSLMGQYCDFWNLTSDALHVSLREFKLDSEALHAPLMQAYLQLAAFSEVPGLLALLKRSGMQVAILTNGSPMMIEAAVEHSQIGQWVDMQLSVDTIGVYKPDARVYQLAVDSLDVSADRVAFMSSNAWDASGAAHFGFNVAWVNRYSQPSEALPGTPSAMLSDLSELPELLGIC